MNIYTDASGTMDVEATTVVIGFIMTGSPANNFPNTVAGAICYFGSSPHLGSPVAPKENLFLLR